MPWGSADDQAEAPTRKLLTDVVLSALRKGQAPPKTECDAIANNFALYVIECIWAVIEETLEPDHLPDAVKSVEHQGHISSLVCHAFWLVWADIEGPHLDAFAEDLTSDACDAPLSNPQATRVVAALQECRKKEVVDDTDVFEVLDLRLLVQSGLSAPHANTSSFGRKMTIARNARSMKITLFNTFREELEGFSKLVTLLNNPALRHSDQVPKLCTEMDQLMGYYRLNPAKVCTCIIAAMERSPDIATLLTKVPCVSPLWCLEAVKRRLIHANSPGSVGLSQPFFTVVAILLKEYKLKLSDVLGQLAPSFDALPHSESEFKALADEMRAADKEAGQGAAVYGEHLNLDVTARDCGLTAELGDPPPVRLATALLEHGAWSHARTVLTHCKFHLVAHRRVCGALLHRLDGLLSEIPVLMLPAEVTTKMGSNDGKDGSSAIVAPVLTTVMLQMLEAAGPLIFRSPQVLLKLWKLANTILRSSDSSDSQRQDTVFAIRHALLPASCFVGSNAQLWIIVQQCLFTLPQLQRCQLYHDTAVLFQLDPKDPVADQGSTSCSLMDALLSDHARCIGRILSTLGKKTRLPDGTPEREQEAKHLSKVVQKVVLAHPFGAATRMVELCRMYDSNADLFLYYSTGLLPVAQEITMFEALRFFICANRDRTGPDMASPDDWLNNIVRFVGRLAAQATHLDVYVIFAYLCQSLKLKEHPLDVQLAGAVFENNLSSFPDQLDHEQCSAFFFGPIYRSHKLTIEYLSESTIASRCARLVNSISGSTAQGPSLLVACFILLCQQRAQVCMTARTQNVRAMFEATQRTHHVVLHYIRLMTSLKVGELVKVLPRLPVLIGTCQVGPECAMAVYRPILRALYNLDSHDETKYDQPVGEGITLEVLVEDLRQCIPMLSPSSKLAFDPYFFILFWAMGLPDLAEDAEERYAELKKELLAKLDVEKRELKDLSTSADRTRSKTGRPYDAQDEPIVSQATLESKKQGISELEEKLTQLQPECDACQSHSISTMEVLKQHAHKCIPSASGQHSLSNAFMQECITPRCVFSREDAMFCARILLKFAALNASNFSLPFMVNAVFSEVLCLLRACTLQETVHLAVFIKEIFLLLDQTNNEEWISEHPVTGSNGKALSLEEWEKLQRKFQKRTSSTLTSIFQDDKSDELIQRNALRLLLDLLPSFPKKEEDQKAIVAALDTLNERKTSTQSVKMMIESAKRNITHMRSTHEVVDMAEDGEVPDDGIGAPSGGASQGGGSKRHREGPGDGHRSHARPRVDMSRTNNLWNPRQFGGQRGN